MNLFRVVFIVFTFSAFVLLDSVYAQAQIVVPNSLTNTEGGFFPGFDPYECGSFGTMRLQQVYLGSEIGPLEIGKISYRLDENFTSAFGPTTLPGLCFRQGHLAV